MSQDWDAETDVLVAGAGACGLAAAVAASEGGADVSIVEKSDRLGQCNTALSTGSVPGANTRFQREAGIEDSPQRFFEDLMRRSGPHDVPELSRLLAQESAPLVEWLVDELEVDLRLITDYKHVGHSVERLHAPPSRRGEDLLNDLIRAAKARAIPVALASPIVELVVDHGAVVGAVVGGGRAGSTRIAAKKVILGTNGFAAHPDLVRKYCPDIAGAPYFGALGSTGEAVLWGEQLGAKLANMGAYQGYATLVHPQGSLLSWTAVELGGILVNDSGHRFGDESAGYSGFAQDVLAQGRFVYSLFDQRIRDYVASHEEEFRELVASGALFVAPSPHDVATRWNIDPDALAVTIRGYERAAKGEVADGFGRKHFGMAPLQPPYVVVRVQAGLFHTQGGLWVDQDARPSFANGGAVRNLFVGGGAAAGISGLRGGAGYSSGSGLLSALGLGRIAGRTAAREVRAESSVA